MLTYCQLVTLKGKFKWNSIQTSSWKKYILKYRLHYSSHFVQASMVDTGSISLIPVHFWSCPGLSVSTRIRNHLFTERIYSIHEKPISEMTLSLLTWNIHISMYTHRIHLIFQTYQSYQFLNVLRTTGHNWKFENSRKGHISKCLIDTTYNASSSHGVDELKLKLSKYGNVDDGEAQQDSFQCLLLIMDILDKGFVRYSTDEYMATSYTDSLSELLFSFVWGKKYCLWRMRTAIPLPPCKN